MGSQNSARSKKTLVALIVAASCAAAATLLIAARKPAEPKPMAAVDAQMQVAALQEAAPNSTPAMPAAAKKSTVRVGTAAPAKAAVKKSPAAKAVSAANTPATIATYEGPAAKTQTVESETKAPAQDSPVRAAVLPPASPAVTIAGCLERDGDGFRLKDTTGNAAPKSRSWKSGFLKKGTPRIQLIDAANRLTLGAHVGQRVSVSGTLNDREMQARSLQRVSTSCE